MSYHGYWSPDVGHKLMPLLMLHSQVWADLYIRVQNEEVQQDDWSAGKVS